MTDVSAATRGNSPGGCAGSSVLLLCSCRVQSKKPNHFWHAHRLQLPVHNLKTGLLMICLTFGWVFRAVAVSSGSPPLRSLSVVGQGYDLLASGPGQTWPGDLLFQCQESHSGLGSFSEKLQVFQQTADQLSGQ